MRYLAFLYLVVLASVSPSGHAASDLPRIHAAVHAGQLDAAVALLRVHLRQHPDDAEAHYLEAELDARHGALPAARQALAAAEMVAPDLSFTSSTALEHLRRLLGGRHASHPPRDHVKLALTLLASVVIVVTLRRHSRPLHSTAWSRAQATRQDAPERRARM